MKVSQIMKKIYVSFEPGDTLLEAAKTLSEKGLREAPVVHQGKLAGTLSTSDIAAALVKKSIIGTATAADASKARSGFVQDHMDSHPSWLDENAEVVSAIAFLIHRNADCIPVLDKKKRVVGLVMAQDLRKEMVALLAAGTPIKKSAGMTSSEKVPGGTAIDQILHYVQERGSASAEEVARQFHLPTTEIEEYAVSLEKHGLLKLEYNIIGKMKMKKAE